MRTGAGGAGSPNARFQIPRQTQAGGGVRNGQTNAAALVRGPGAGFGSWNVASGGMLPLAARAEVCYRSQRERNHQGQEQRERNHRRQGQREADGRKRWGTAQWSRPRRWQRGGSLTGTGRHRPSSSQARALRSQGLGLYRMRCNPR
jgi:hypothetical protein